MCEGLADDHFLLIARLMPVDFFVCANNTSRNRNEIVVSGSHRVTLAAGRSCHKQIADKSWHSRWQAR